MRSKTKQELEKELAHKTEELDRIKEVLAIYLDKVYYDLDDITPDDLECKLRDNEMDKYKNFVDNNIHSGEMLYLSWIRDIEALCRDLNWTEFSGVSSCHNIKLFIKSLARENFTLKKNMEGGKRDGDTRTNSLGSSRSATNK